MRSHCESDGDINEQILTASYSPIAQSPELGFVLDTGIWSQCTGDREMALTSFFTCFLLEVGVAVFLIFVMHR